MESVNADAVGDASMSSNRDPHNRPREGEMGVAIKTKQ